MRALLLILLAAAPAHIAIAVPCSVKHPAVLTEPQKALLDGNYARAEEQFKAELAKKPGDVELTAGLVHALLKEEKVSDAAEVVKTARATAPNDPELLTLRGEVEYRQGMPWVAALTANAAAAMDPCNAEAILLQARIARINSMHATAEKLIDTAHQLDPHDPEIRLEWLNTLPLQQRMTELESYLSAPQALDAEELRNTRMYLDSLKKRAAEPHAPCRLVSNTSSTEIPFIKLMYDPLHMKAFGLEVKLNKRSARLEIDTGASGLLISHSVAEKAGLKPFATTEVGGIGDHGDKSAYTAYVDSIHIGKLEFQNCTVRVLDGRNPLDEDGIIGMDVLSHFLITLDYPMHKLVLGPLPPRPGESVPAPGLSTGAPGSDSETKSPSTQERPNLSAAPHGAFDRYVAPEMRDYIDVYRVGHDLILPASLNNQRVKLFIMDTGAWTTTISPEAAREVTKVRNESTGLEVRGISGKVEKLYSTGEITFRFGHLAQRADELVAFDTSSISKDAGMEISGFIGAATLRQLTIHIDYRDGLVKFDYDPNRGYRF